MDTYRDGGITCRVLAHESPTSHPTRAFMHWNVHFDVRSQLPKRYLQSSSVEVWSHQVHLIGTKTSLFTQGCEFADIRFGGGGGGGVGQSRPEGKDLML